MEEEENKVLSCIHVSNYQCLNTSSTPTVASNSKSQILPIKDSYIKKDYAHQEEELNEQCK